MASSIFDERTREIVQKDGTLTGGHRPEVIIAGAGVSLSVSTGTVDQGNPNAGGASAWPVDTELPAAAAMAEGVSNPTVPGVAAFLASWNGFTWDRVRSPEGDAAPVTGILSAAPMLFNGSGYDRQRADGTDASLLWTAVHASH